jgi:hypothetical protein
MYVCTHLNLSNKDITDDELKIYAITCPDLKYLNLSGCRAVTDEGLASVAKLTTLESLTLSGCRAITDEGLASLANLTHLQQLNLSGCVRLTGKGFKYLRPENLSCLVRFTLGCCGVITKEGFANLGSLTQLYYLDLSGYRGIITEWDAKQLINLHANLRELNLSNCNQIADWTLLILTNLRKLERLYLSNCHQITDDGCFCLSRFVNLKYLELRECDEITMKGVIYLKHLQYMDLRDCAKITDRERAQLRNLRNLIHPNLRDVNFAYEKLVSYDNV